MSEVRVCKLHVKYDGEDGDVEALQNVSFTVQTGEFLTILGPSGCGKSTLIRAIAGFLKPEHGCVIVNGRTVSEPGSDRVMVFQEFDQLFPWLTVLDNVAFPLNFATSADSMMSKMLARKYLRMVGLNDFDGAFPHQLSGGMKQRVAIARALAMEPGVLLMDEPFGSLDAQTRAILQTELVRIHQEVGSTTIFITHNIQEAIILGDRILMLTTRPGRIKALVENPLDKPRMPETPEFMALWHDLYEMLEVKRY